MSPEYSRSLARERMQSLAVWLGMTCACILGSATSTAAGDVLEEKSDFEKSGAYFYGPRYYKDGRLEMPRGCSIKAREADATLKAGALLELLNHRSAIELKINAGRIESTLATNQYYQVHVEPGVVADIGRLTHLEYLDLCNLDLTEMDAFNSLANLQKLTHLQLHRCKLEQHSLRFLTKLENLQEMSLSDCDVRFKDIVAALPACPNLKRISVYEYHSSEPLPTTGIERESVVNPSDIAKLVKGSPGLKEVSLATDELYEPAALVEFTELESLNSLHIRVVTRPEGFKYPPLHPKQLEECKWARHMFEQKGLKRWVSSSQSRRKSFTLPAYALYVPEMSENPAN